MSSREKTHFLFLIYTTMERRTKANLLYTLLNRKLSQTTIYILISKPELEIPFEFSNHEIFLKCGQYFEDHSQKTLAMISFVNKMFPQISGLFKCNDNILPNISAIQKFIKNMANLILQGESMDYGGVLLKTHTHKNYRYTEHFGLCHDPLKNDMLVQLPRNLTYACNAFYYLSRKALASFSKKCTEYFYDDVMIAQHLLNSSSIVPQSMELFRGNMDSIFQTSVFNTIQNGVETFKTLYITLQGNLGERMFQTAAAYGIAKRKKMYLVFVDESEFNVFHRLFLKEFPCIDPSKIVDLLNDAYPLLENEDSGDIPEAVFATNRDVFMCGYFKNIDYFQDCSLEVYSLFQTPLAMAKQIFQKKGISAGFKSVRRYSTSSNISVDSNSCMDGSQFLRGSGDLDEPDKDALPFEKSFFIYVSENQTNEYLKKALAYIYEYEWKPYFYILSHFDDDETLERFDALKTLQKTIITIRSSYTSQSDKSGCSELSSQSMISDNNLIDALAIMTLCKRGGITSTKDPVSWWGGYLNDNIRKIIVQESCFTHGHGFERTGIFVKGKSLFF